MCGPRVDLENHRPRVRCGPSKPALLRNFLVRFPGRILPRLEGHRDSQNFVSDPSLGSHFPTQDEIGDKSFRGIFALGGEQLKIEREDFLMNFLFRIPAWGSKTQAGIGPFSSYMQPPLAICSVARSPETGDSVSLRTSNLRHERAIHQKKRRAALSGQVSL
jgi:hypothetical protein